MDPEQIAETLIRHTAEFKCMVDKFSSVDQEIASLNNKLDCLTRKIDSLKTWIMGAMAAALTTLVAHLLF